MEKLIKNALGQWSIIKEELYKSPIDPPPSSPKPQATPLVPAATPEATSPSAKSPMDQNSQHLSGLFNQMKEHQDGGNEEQVKALKGQIKDHVLKAPKGSIDFGALGDLRESQSKGDAGRAINHADMAEMINHHLGDAKSIKDIHDNHGGMKAVGTLMRTMGTSGETREYSTLNFKKPGVHEDLLDLVRPGKAIHDRQSQRHLGVRTGSYLGSTPSDPELEKTVAKTFDNFFSDPQMFDHPTNPKDHEHAVVARGLDRFKRHHKL